MLGVKVGEGGGDYIIRVLHVFSVTASKPVKPVLREFVQWRKCVNQTTLINIETTGLKHIEVSAHLKKKIEKSMQPPLVQ